MSEFYKTLGNKIRLLRRSAGMTQSDLADALSLSFQQVQKYETGMNRVSAERLHQLAQLFNISVEVLLPSNTAPNRQGAAEAQMVQITRSYERITQPLMRQVLHDLMQMIAEYEHYMGQDRPSRS